MKMKTTITIIVLLVSQLAAFAIKPEKEYKMRPSDLEIEYREHRIVTGDGAELNTWIMIPAQDKANGISIVIVGSDAGNMGYSVFYAKNLIDLGYTVISFDYRGFGDSTEFQYNPNNVYHSEYVTDFQATMDWARKDPSVKRVGVLGLSMGTLIANLGYHRSHYDFFIGEAFVWSPAKNRQRILELKNKKLDLPESANKDEKLIVNAMMPTLLFAGKQDVVTTVEDSKRFCNTRTDSRTIVYDGGHLRGIVELGVEDYFSSIDQFIQGY